MRTALALILFFHFSWASPKSAFVFPSKQIIYNPSNTPVGQFILSVEDYEDIRIDSDLDGKIDFWHIKNKNLQIGIRYKGDHVDFIEIESQKQNTAYSWVLVPKGNGFRIAKASHRKSLVMNGQIEDICTPETNNVLNEIKKFSNQVDESSLKVTSESYIDDSCDPKANETAFESIRYAISDVLSNELSKNSFSSCLNGKSALKLVDGTPQDAKLGLDFLSAKTALDLKKLAHGDNSASALFTCSFSDKVTKASASYEEGSKIKLSIPSNPSSFPKGDQLKNLIRHELLHRAGLKDESLTGGLIKACSSGESTDLADAGKSNQGTVERVDASALKVANESTADSKSDTAAAVTQKKSGKASASATGGGGDGVDLKSEIASAKTIPSAEKLAQTKTDKSPEGIAAAVKDSQATSAPVLRMANQVMGVSNTPANAEDDSSTSTASYSSGGGGGSSSGSATRSISSVSAPTTYDSSSSSRSSDSDSSSSKERYQSRHDRYQSGSINAGTSTGGLAKGERVVEEIDLTKGTNYKASTGSSATNTRQVTQTQTQAQSDTQSSATKTASASRGPASTTATPTRAAMGGDVSAGASSGGGSGSSGRGLGSNSTAQALGTLNSDGTGNANRKAGNNSRSPASTTTSSSRDEIVTFLSNGDYTRTKNKLRDSNFISNLKENKIKILDLYGGQVGADKADVIFLDQGDKFSRQK